MCLEWSKGHVAWKEYTQPQNQDKPLCCVCTAGPEEATAPSLPLGTSSFTGWRYWLLVSVRCHAAVKWDHSLALSFPSCYCWLVTKSCPTLCDPMDCSPPDSSVHEISQARILEWVAVSFSRGSSFLVLLYHYIDPRLRCQMHFMIWLWEVLLSLVKQTNKQTLQRYFLKPLGSCFFLAGILLSVTAISHLCIHF